MIRNRIVAVVLFVIALLALTATRAFPFRDDIPELVKVAITIGGAACVLTGVWLWLRKEPEAAESDRPESDQPGAGAGPAQVGGPTPGE